MATRVNKLQQWIDTLHAVRETILRDLRKADVEFREEKELPVNDRSEWHVIVRTPVGNLKISTETIIPEKGDKWFWIFCRFLDDLPEDFKALGKRPNPTVQYLSTLNPHSQKWNWVFKFSSFLDLSNPETIEDFLMGLRWVLSQKSPSC